MAEAYNINTIGAVMCAQAFHPLLRTAAAANDDKPMGAERALIFNLSSLLGSIELNVYGSGPGGVPYNCSKVVVTY
jgi:NAD(P)-dependent dehydrogenase (short-subunit alcohol dehydrogenase family)